MLRSGNLIASTLVPKLKGCDTSKIKLFIELELALVRKDLMFYMGDKDVACWVHSFDQEICVYVRINVCIREK